MFRHPFRNLFPLSFAQRLALQVFILVAILAVIITFLANNASTSIYEERKGLVELSTGTAASIIDEDAAAQWEMTQMTIAMVEHASNHKPTIEQAIGEVTAEYDFGDNYFFVVDSQGRFYCSDGINGRLSDFAHYRPDSEPRDEYLANLPHRDQQRTYTFFRQRLQTPLRTTSQYGDTEILYLVFAQDFDHIKQSIVSLFPGDVNVFIFDEDGIMLLKDFGISLLIEGYNIYPKFSQSTRPFGEDPDSLVQRCRDRQPLVVRLDIHDDPFYFCSSPIHMQNMSLAFIIHADRIEDLANHSFSRILLSLIAIAVVLCITIITLVATILRRRTAETRLADSQRVAIAMSAASKAKTDFLSNMSHDIRTPINGIMGVTTLAKAAVDDPAKMRDCLDKIEGASSHLLSLINDVLDMSRIESGKTQITTHPEDIRTICDNCCSIINGQLAERDIHFVNEVNATHTHVLADDLHLRQVLINILGNAVKFTRDGGSIWFRCNETSHDPQQQTVHYTIQIEDTGRGMSPDFLQHIFEPFSQEGDSPRSKYKGTGLGMSITKQLLDLMQARIVVTSEVDKGSCFTIDIDFEIASDDLFAPVLDIHDASIQGVKVLLVEDNELNIEIASELLRMKGAEVETAVDGQEAYQRFADSAPYTWDVILMDIMMPHMNGLEATRAIRALPRPDATDTPIIAMTANAFDDDIRATAQAGMNAHLSKPIIIDEVVRTIAQHIHTHND